MIKGAVPCAGGGLPQDCVEGTGSTGSAWKSLRARLEPEAFLAGSPGKQLAEGVGGEAGPRPGGTEAAGSSALPCPSPPASPLVSPPAEGPPGPSGSAAEGSGPGWPDSEGDSVLNSGTLFQPVALSSSRSSIASLMNLGMAQHTDNNV